MFILPAMKYYLSRENHCNDVINERLKSPASPMFTQPFN